MNGKIVLAASTFMTLAACQGAGQLEQKPPTWTAMYQAHWEPMANCIVARSQTDLYDFLSQELVGAEKDPGTPRSSSRAVASRRHR